MKTKNKILLILSGMYALIVMSAMNSHAQSYFNSASVTPDVMASSISAVLNTGNDGYGGNGKTWEVSVWDSNGGSPPGLGWFVDDLVNTPPYAIGNTPLFYGDAIDPDVVLMLGDNYTTVYAVAVYYSASASSGAGGYVWEFFKANGAYPQTFSPVNHYDLVQDSYGKAINIDRNELYNFAIVWDNGSGDVYCQTGIAGSVTPQVNCAVPLPIISGATMPDVAMYYDAVTGNEHVLVAYVLASGEVEVVDEDFLTLAGCSSSPTIVYTSGAPATNYAYYYPRIASAGGYAGWEVPWTVVYENNYPGGNSYFIEGATNTYGTPPIVVTHTYNDGSADSPYDISTVENLRPVVTYSDSDPNLMLVGWTFNNLSGYYSSNPPLATAAARYPIVLACDSQGYMQSGAKYMDVPPLAANDDFQKLSISGKFDRYYYHYTYYDENSGDVLAKRVTPAATSLRIAPTAVDARDAPFLYPNPFSDNLSIEVRYTGTLPNKNEYLFMLTAYDISGKEIFSLAGNEENLNKKLSKKTASLDKGVYFFKIYSQDKTEHWIEKLVKM